MAWPFDQITLPDWVTGYVNAVDMLNKITARFNSLWSAVSLGRIGENNSSSTVTLSTTSNFAGSAALTFTLTSQRRVRIAVLANFRLASGASGTYFLNPAYNSGASAVIGSATLLNPVAARTATIVNVSDAVSTEGTVLLAAGTYTAYCAVSRNAGGSATDTVRTNWVGVFDVGT